MALTELPRGVRAAANRAARPRRPPAPGSQLAAAARAGVLTRSNTRPGTTGRQAADQVLYERREARRAPGETARAAAGHRKAPAAGGMSGVFKDAGFVVIENPTPGERRRLGRFNARVGELVEGQISPRRFERMIGGWRPLRGMRFESDPEVVLAILDIRRETGEDIFIYVGRRS